ncbi:MULTISPECIES: zinc ribbon domain-containing protein [unclassified Streptomyces]|uniref:Zn-ribbon domain-containing OB-fold protein n=1 Tax=unclassified Streptomyces TaxID=2593676 RepID=UPI0033B706B9
MFHPGIGIAADVLDADVPESNATVPVESGAPAWAGKSSEERLAFQRCRWCGTTMFHRLLCPVCASSDLRTERSQGTGIVRRTTVVRRNTPAARNVSLIEMAEGFTVRGRVKGPFIAIHPGGRVRLTVAEDPVRGEPVFELCDDPYGLRP